jgi:Desulfoferrodoxin, N-terminal domain
MARTKTVTYECEQCGSEIVVTSTGEGELSPIYCCGIEVMEIASMGKKAVSPKKKAVKKVSGTKGISKKSTPAKKRRPKK